MSLNTYQDAGTEPRAFIFVRFSHFSTPRKAAVIANYVLLKYFKNKSNYLITKIQQFVFRSARPAATQKNETATTAVAWLGGGVSFSSK